MQFSDTTSKRGIIQKCEFWCGFGDGGISGDATLLKIFTGLCNDAYHELVTDVIGAQDEWDFDDPNHGDAGFIKTYDLVSGTAYFDLTLTSKILKIKRLELQLDGSTWKKASPIDIGEINFAVSDTSLVSSSFSTQSPRYDQHGRYVYVYPIPATNVTAGAKAWVSREIDEFTSADTTQEPGFDEPWHQMIPLKASFEYASGKGLANAPVIAALLADKYPKFLTYYGKKNDDRQINLQAHLENYR